MKNKVTEKLSKSIVMARMRMGVKESGLSVEKFAASHDIPLTTFRRALNGEEPKREVTKEDFARAYNVETYEDLRVINSHNLYYLWKYFSSQPNGILMIVVLMLVIVSAAVYFLTNNPIGMLLAIVLMVVFLHIARNIWTGETIADTYSAEVNYEGLATDSDEYQSMQKHQKEKRQLVFVDCMGLLSVVLILVWLFV